MSDFRITDSRERFWIVLITLLATPLTGAGIDIYVPSLPVITRIFSIPASLAQLTLSIYLVGYGLFQPIAGPLADRFGRRYLLASGTLLATLFSLMAAWSPNIDILLIARFLQGVAIAGLGVAVRATFPDTYQGKTLRKMMPLLTISWAIGPILAPYIGAHLQNWFNWRASFYFLAAYSGLVLLLTLRLPETLHDRHLLKYAVIKTNYLTILKSRLFLGWMAMAVIFYAFIVVFAVIGPFLVEKVMHHSPIFYGSIAVAIGILWFLGGLTSRILSRFHPSDVLPTLYLVSLAVSTLALIYVIKVPLSIFSLVTPSLTLFYFAAIIFSFCYNSALILFPKIAGSNSAASGTILSLGVGILSGLAVLLKTNDDIALFVVFWAFFVIATTIYFLVVKLPLVKTK